MALKFGLSVAIISAVCVSQLILQIEAQTGARTTHSITFDCDPEQLFDTTNDFYKKCLTNSKILVTPHVAAITEGARANAMETLVQNVEAFAKGAPQNVLDKQ